MLQLISCPSSSMPIYLTDWVIIINLSDRRGNARNLQLLYTSKLEVIWDQTTYNFLVYNLEQYNRGTVKTPHTRLFESNLLAGFNLCEAVVSKILHPRYTGEPAILSVLPPSGEYTRQEHAFNTTFNITAINTIIINIVSSKSTWMFANLLWWYVECLSSHIYLLIHVHTWDDKKYLKRESNWKWWGKQRWFNDFDWFGDSENWS